MYLEFEGERERSNSTGSDFPTVKRRYLKSPGLLFEDLDKLIVTYILMPLVPVGSEWTFTESKIQGLYLSLYTAALNFVKLENRLEFERSTESYVRESRLRYGRAASHVAQCLKLIEKSQMIVGLEIKRDLGRGVLSFREVKTTLTRLYKTLLLLEGDYSAFIHPVLRTREEANAAQRSPVRLLWRPKTPLSQKSKYTQYEAVRKLEGAVRRFTNGKLSSSAIDTFIVKFFETVLNEKGLTTEAVKTIRRRIKEKTRLKSMKLATNSSRSGQNI